MRRLLDLNHFLLLQAEALARRAISCLNPSDPKIATVVTNDREMETALLIAKVLEASAMIFSAGKGANKQAATLDPVEKPPLEGSTESAARVERDPEPNSGSYEFGLGGYPQRRDQNPPKLGFF